MENKIYSIDIIYQPIRFVEKYIPEYEPTAIDNWRTDPVVNSVTGNPLGEISNLKLFAYFSLAER